MSECPKCRAREINSTLRTYDGHVTRPEKKKSCLFCEFCKQGHKIMTAWCERSDLEIKFDALKQELLAARDALIRLHEDCDRTPDDCRHCAFIYNLNQFLGEME